MLKSLTVRGFKSLGDVTVAFPRMAVLFGPNAAGKSNLLDAIQALSRIGTQRTLADALADPIRGHPVEAFTFPSGGLPDLLSASSAEFTLAADLTRKKDSYRYRVSVAIAPGSGALTVGDEYLSPLGQDGQPKGTAAIEQVDQKLRVRRKGESGKPRYEPLHQNYAILSDPRLGRPLYPAVEAARTELSDWRTYYLDPRVAMRAAQPPSDVRDIGVLGGEIAPFLYRLRADHPNAFQAVSRTLRSIVPSVEDLTVDLDKRRGTLDILVRQGGVDYSSRIVSEGTLRVLALCALAVNPWGGSLLAFEEPENGVHPRRIELIAQLLLALATEQGRQVVVTTHSPLFCDAILKGARAHAGDVGLFNVRRDGAKTAVHPFDVTGPLFKDPEITAALTAATEDGLFESMMLRGLLDE
jgi:predicted ATPase